jgi:hypothetical protein
MTVDETSKIDLTISESPDSVRDVDARARIYPFDQQLIDAIRRGSRVHDLAEDLSPKAKEMLLSIAGCNPRKSSGNREVTLKAELHKTLNSVMKSTAATGPICDLLAIWFNEHSKDLESVDVAEGNESWRQVLLMRLRTRVLGEHDLPEDLRSAADCIIDGSVERLPDSVHHRWGMLLQAHTARWIIDRIRRQAHELTDELSEALHTAAETSWGEGLTELVERWRGVASNIQRLEGQREQACRTLALLGRELLVACQGFEHASKIPASLLEPDQPDDDLVAALDDGLLEELFAEAEERLATIRRDPEVERARALCGLVAHLEGRIPTGFDP